MKAVGAPFWRFQDTAREMAFAFSEMDGSM
jgi:hypothetical protein